MNQVLGGLKDKVILITGGASGIGLASAQVAAANGAKVVCADLAQTQDLPAGCEFRKLDVSDWEMTQALVEDVVARHGQIDGLVTSAGISRVGDLQGMTLQEWEQVLQINLTGTMLSARAVAAHMKQRKQGSIVAIASINGILGNPSNLAYCTSKGGVLQMVRSLAADFGLHGVRVNAISPGLIHTNDGRTGSKPCLCRLRQTAIAAPSRRISRGGKCGGVFAFRSGVVCDGRQYSGGWRILRSQSH